MPARLMSSSLAMFLAAGALLYHVWQKYTEQIHIWYALKGVSPMAWAYQLANPEIFAKNFPGGYEVFSKSSFMYIYPLAKAVLGLDPSSILTSVVALEIVALSLAVYLLSRLLFPESATAAHVALALLVIASYARSMNIGWFGAPYFKGVYYNAADVFRILAVIMALKRRYVWSGVCIAAAFSCHPLMGIHAGIFVFTMTLFSRPARQDWMNAAAGAVLCVILSAVWMISVYDSQNISNTGISAERWFELTRLFGGHFYPITAGFFSRNSKDFIGLISLTLLLFHYIRRRSGASALFDRQMMAGAVALIFVSVAGVFISEYTTIPLLAKLTLFRASELYIIIALVYAVNGLWRDIESGKAVCVAIAAVILLSPFYLAPGLPVIFSVLLVSPVFLRVYRGASPTDLFLALLAGFAIVLPLFYAVYYANQSPGDFIARVEAGYIAPVRAGYYMSGAALVGMLIGVPAFAVKKWADVNLVPLAVFVLLLASPSTYLNDRLMDSGNQAKGRDFMQAQLWVKHNTPPDALFMKDPALFHPSYNPGWREYSQRPSFGTMYEWTVLPALYVSDSDILGEGLRRLGEFGIDLDEYINMKTDQNRFRLLQAKAHALFYQFDDSWRLRLARKYGIDYFVLQRDMIVKPSHLPVVFENNHIVIVSSGRPPTQNNQHSQNPGSPSGDK